MSTPIRVDQILAGYAEGDAISGEARLFQKCFRACGFASEIFVEDGHISPTVRQECRVLAEYQAGPEDVAVYHFSIGSMAADVFLRTAAKKIVCYHNITPAEYFRGFDDELAAQLTAGRHLLKRVADAAQAVWADSAFNAAEIRAQSQTPASVVELLFTPETLDTPPHPAIQAKFAVPMTNFLFVGRVAPNKRIEELIEAFAWYHKAIDPMSRLVIVGSDRSCPRYFTMLRMYAAELNLPNVCLETFVAAECLGTYYQLAQVFVTASEHEGYCLPVVEAMARGVPVLAKRTGGVPEAMGGAGVLYEGLSARELAELMHLLATDISMRTEVLASQQKRLARIRQRPIQDEIRNLLAATGTKASP